ncbi:MAG: carboxypeptidase regulatory-like domain-containing protein [Bacteroidales bacterium]|nr:carboxypeptidase regulatory-like domain-containing protein [Bacteroidales bacterium]
MAKRFILALAAVLASAVMFAQTGGVKGTVVDRDGRQPVEGARLVLLQGAERLAEVSSAQDGTFMIPNLKDGMYTLLIEAPDYLETQVQVTVNDGYVKNMFNLSISGIKKVTELDDDSFAAFDMDDSGYNDNPTILFGSNDVFNNIAGYNFSAVRFRARGYSSESQDVYLAGVKLNDAITGYGPFSLWSGLNEAMRTKETVNGSEVSEYGFGGYNGVTNIFGNALNVRKGLRGSVLTNSTLYRLRLMASYATGMMDNGWAFAANVSARLGGNDWIDGVYYKSLAYYFAADKAINDANTVSFVFFATPGERGAQNASTQEVYDLMKDNMYNSNWGYQNGKVRNARVRKTNEPIAFIKWNYAPSDKFEANTTIMYRFGTNGYTALDWYDAQDPRPDYYRNLPSYFMDSNPDMNRHNDMKYGWAQEVWTHSKLYPELTHVNWDRLYNVNALQGGRSKYIQEQRHVDQRDLNLAASFKYRSSDHSLVTGGLSARINRTEYYKKVADLLGGEYFLDIDNFAERDFAATPYKLQNDLDYYIANGEARTLGVGDKYGYDYLAQVRNYEAWLNERYTLGDLEVNVGGRIGYNSFWRDGLIRKGLFPGVDENGNKLVVDGVAIEPTYESDGETVTTSYGKSKVSNFLTYAAKLGLNYVLDGSSRVYANVGYFADAPKFNQAFLSPRTRNSLMEGLTTAKTFSSDVNYQYSANGINFRGTLYYTTIKDQSKVMSAYDDLQNAFSNFAITGINQRNMGLEIGFKMPTYIIPNLSLQGVLALGEYVYTSTPNMTQTVDNSSEIVMNNVPVAYWKQTEYTNADGKYVKQKHYIPSTPQTAMSLGLAYNYNYWFIDGDVEFFDRAYLDMNPLYRTDYAVAGLDNTITDTEVEYMTTQEKFAPAFLVNISIGKSWYIQRKYQLGFSLNAKNLLNNKKVKTGGYEQTRIVDNTVNAERFYRFDPKYFYMAGTNYMLNIYFRF